MVALPTTMTRAFSCAINLTRKVTIVGALHDALSAEGGEPNLDLPLREVTLPDRIEDIKSLLNCVFALRSNGDVTKVPTKKRTPGKPDPLFFKSIALPKSLVGFELQTYFSV
ncbi:hypothetical protein [Gordonibacter sp.]|uniref:hypothetical protein n=1 Tax=Gordonibacter sp. TaxID=1968902 RepID=UPI0025C2AA7A|nr:hypothetical protein [Gordonibacter sp.]